MMVAEFPEPEPGEFPKKRCREGIFTSSGQGYSCELPLFHYGPCMTYSSQETVKARARWAEVNPEKAGKLDSQDIVIGEDNAR